MVAEPISIAPKSWTYDEVQAAFTDEVRRELYDGEIFEMPSPTNQHQKIYRSVLKQIEAWIDQNRQGIVYLPPLDLRISPTVQFIPDLMFYLEQDAARIEHPSGRGLVAPPDLIVEIISPSTAQRDREIKYRSYARFGVDWYWIFDPQDQTLHVYQRAGRAYREEAVLQLSEVFRPTFLPGLQLNLNEVFGA